MKGIESLSKHLVKCQKGRRIISFEKSINKRKTVFIIQNIQIAEHILILDISTAESHGLVKDCKRIAHRAVSLVGYDMKRLVIDGDTFIGGHHPEVSHDVLDGDPVEIICLASRENGWKDLVLFSSGKNEYSMCRWLLKCLEEGIERSLRKHMHLVDDIDAVSSDLWRYAHLLHQGLDVLNSIV